MTEEERQAAIQALDEYRKAWHELLNELFGPVLESYTAELVTFGQAAVMQKDDGTFKVLSQEEIRDLKIEDQA